MAAAPECDDRTAERVARNEARFRESNEQLLAAAKELGFGPDELTPYLCECTDVACTTVVRLTKHDYEAVRTNSRRFINAPGHERNAHGWARVVEEFDHYSVVEKIGRAGDIAAQLDTRQGAVDE